MYLSRLLTPITNVMNICRSCLNSRRTKALSYNKSKSLILDENSLIHNNLEVYWDKLVHRNSGLNYYTDYVLRL